MAAWPGLAGVSWAGRGGNAGLAVPVANAAGNNLPGITGALPVPPRPGPGPAAGGAAGWQDKRTGADPRAARIQPDPHVSRLGDGQETDRRYALQGFNDQLTVKDRHAYWDTGTQKTGVGFQPGNPANAYNDPVTESPRPDLRALNRTVSWQVGSDATRNQDDLTRPYTWLGQQGSGWIPVYGGVPGLYQPYGTRGGIPYPIVAPVEQGQPGDGPHLVFAGPPHGLHSQTPWKGGAQIIARYTTTPQMTLPRIDRPSNSPQAGQSYSQTVLPQGATRPPRRGAGPGGISPASAAWLGGRGWSGQNKPTTARSSWLTGNNQ